MQQGYNLKKNGFRKPNRAAFSKTLDINKKSATKKITESVRGEKRVEDSLTFAYDFVETENKNKEVFEHQLVTRS